MSDTNPPIEHVILRLRPGATYVFAESEAAFRASWQEALRGGELLEVVGVVDTRAHFAGTPMRDLDRPSRLTINPSTIHVVELYDGADWDLLKARDATRPEHIREREERQAETLAKEKQERELASTAALLDSFRELAKKANQTATNRDEMVLSDGSVVEGWVVTTWTDIEEATQDLAGFRAAPNRIYERALFLETDGTLHQAEKKSFFGEYTVARKALRRIVGNAPRHGPDTKNLGQRWEGGPVLTKSNLQRALQAAEQFKLAMGGR